MEQSQASAGASTTSGFAELPVSLRAAAQEPTEYDGEVGVLLGKDVVPAAGYKSLPTFVIVGILSLAVILIIFAYLKLRR